MDSLVLEIRVAPCAAVPGGLCGSGFKDASTELKAECHPEGRRAAVASVWPLAESMRPITRRFVDADPHAAAIAAENNLCHGWQLRLVPCSRCVRANTVPTKYEQCPSD
ncbi:hypothetical protein MTO96_030638 [Rhipicephalus appendiculatus]